MRRCAAALLLLACGALAQEYPAKPVRVVVPFAAGAATDSLARVIGHELGQSLGAELGEWNRAELEVWRRAIAATKIEPE